MGRMIGIDIGPLHWRAALLEGQKGGAAVLDVAMTEAPAGKVSEWDWNAAMAGLKEKLPGPWPKAMVLVSPVWASVRRVTLPFRTDRKIRQVLPFELENQVCGDMGDLAFDFIRTGTSEKEASVLVATLSQDMISSIRNALDHVGGSCAGIGLAGMAPAQMLLRVAGVSGGICVNHADDAIHLTILENGGIRDFRSIPVASSHPLTADRMGRWVHQFLTGYQDAVNPEFRPEILFASSPDSGIPLTGGLAGCRVDSMAWAGRLGDLPASIPEDSAYGFDNAVAAGWLGLYPQKGPVFARPGAAGDWLASIPRGRLLGSGFLAASTLLCFLIYTGLGVYIDGKRLEKLNSEIVSVFSETFPEVTRIVDPYQQMKIKVSALAAAAAQSGGENSRQRVLDVLAEISRLVPGNTDLALSRMNLFPAYILLNGESDTFNTVDDIKKRLESSAMFQTVTISSASTDQKTERVRFKMRIDR